MKSFKISIILGPGIEVIIGPPSFRSIESPELEKLKNIAWVGEDKNDQEAFFKNLNINVLRFCFLRVEFFENSMIINNCNMIKVVQTNYHPILNLY